MAEHTSPDRAATDFAPANFAVRLAPAALRAAAERMLAARFGDGVAPFAGQAGKMINQAAKIEVIPEIATAEAAWEAWRVCSHAAQIAIVGRNASATAGMCACAAGRGRHEFESEMAPDSDSAWSLCADAVEVCWCGARAANQAARLAKPEIYDRRR